MNPKPKLKPKCFLLNRGLSIGRGEEVNTRKGEWLTKEYQRMGRRDDDENAEPTYEEILRQEKLPPGDLRGFTDPLRVWVRIVNGRVFRFGTLSHESMTVYDSDDS